MAVNSAPVYDSGYLIRGEGREILVTALEAWPSSPTLHIGTPEVFEDYTPATVDGADALWSLSIAEVALYTGDSSVGFWVTVGSGETLRSLVAGTLWVIDEGSGDHQEMVGPIRVVVGPPGAGADMDTISGMVADYLTANPPTAGTVHDQTVAAATWTISHTFGRRPNVAVYLDSGEEVDADVVSTSTQVTITLPAPMTGQAVLT